MGNAQRTSQAGERHEFLAPSPGRVDALLAAALDGVSRARIQRLVETGAVTVNGVLVRKSGQVSTGDRLAIDIPAIEASAATTEVESLPVLFEDEWLIAIDKPAGLAVHGAPGDTSPSVAGWFAQRLGSAAGAFSTEYPGVVHRLDKHTSGVLLLAKTPSAQATLSAAFESRTAHKSYLAICDGVPAQERAVIDAAIARHPADRTRMAIAKHGRASRTEFELVASDRDRSFLIVRPETGRTHQIRVHLAAVNVPVRYDKVYGRSGDGRQLLHAWRLQIPHPDGGTLEVTAPLHADMVAELTDLLGHDPDAVYLRAEPNGRN